MLYEKFPVVSRNEYKKTLGALAALSDLFATSQIPFLDYRVAENVFCKCFGAENLARYCNSADAMIGKIGIGIKTWTKGTYRQKIAEFDKLKSTYSNLTGIELAKRISELRNERIESTMGQFGLDRMIYHCVLREQGLIKLAECKLEKIDIEHIRLTKSSTKDTASIYFTDGKADYSFMSSKSTLFKNFTDLEIVDEFKVDIIEDPYPLIVDFLENYYKNGHKSLSVSSTNIIANQIAYLPLYSIKHGNKFVPLKSGLNQWNAQGRTRDENELYIPFNKEDRNRINGFFPDRDVIFNLELPNKNIIKAKVCQDDGKAIMSNPNKDLGKWLLRDVLHIASMEIVTYEKLLEIGIDCIAFEKVSDSLYKLNFGHIGDYENHLEDWINGVFYHDSYEEATNYSNRD